MGASAQFDGIFRVEGDDSHPISVLLPKESHGSPGTGFLEGNIRLYLPKHVTLDHFVDTCLYGVQVFRRHPFVVAEIEPEVIGRHQRAPLLHVRTKHLAQRGMQQVRSRMVLRDAQTPARIDHGTDGRLGIGG